MVEILSLILFCVGQLILNINDHIISLRDRMNLGLIEWICTLIMCNL